ncbi:carcinoembryonic antigen-related cell adhesion molecule 21-like isoform X2 [Pteronotus mesoamericanus]|uniref:carcinoembryonic antigen-related cell adhesion molecule 21-like isoform X2 n=1 Tax=Pteronotus mesoamericanus TaxID=1884717 RepID=UPI0023ED7ECD|nr:carcinoembryonic antigen-related cell adhesion molecule 21-like isoform X2 [Pteronotus parnellii mesoamericanus]
MEAPSAPAPRRLVLQQELLLAVSLLTFWILPPTAQLTIESMPPDAAEGEDVLLLVHSLPANLLSYSWYKGESVDSNHQIASYIIHLKIMISGPAYSYQETLYPNGSLLFQNVTLKDTGYYTVQAIMKDLQTEVATARLCVYQPVGKPSVRASNTTVTEHKDTVVLSCLTNDTGISTRWFSNDWSLLLTERMKLSQDNSTLTIGPIRREDAGGYQCEVSNPISSSKSEPLRLHVHYENYSGYPVGTIAGIVIGVLVVAALGTSLGCFLCLRRTRRASDPRGRREHRPPASTPGQGPSGASASPGPLDSPRTACPIYEDLLSPSTDVYCQIHPRANGAP